MGAACLWKPLHGAFSGLGCLCKLLFSSGWVGAGILTGAVGGDFLDHHCLSMSLI